MELKGIASSIKQGSRSYNRIQQVQEDRNVLLGKRQRTRDGSPMAAAADGQNKGCNRGLDRGRRCDVAWIVAATAAWIVAMMEA
uniref:Uncharacterized protein n=1 Tax=Oryza brachyantha TaxID=4533 RepID=J3M5S1_ORYBR